MQIFIKLDKKIVYLKFELKKLYFFLKMPGYFISNHCIYILFINSYFLTRRKQNNLLYMLRTACAKASVKYIFQKRMKKCFREFELTSTLKRECVLVASRTANFWIWEVVIRSGSRRTRDWGRNPAPGQFVVYSLVSDTAQKSFSTPGHLNS